MEPLLGGYLATFLAAALICFAATMGVRTFAHPDIRRGLGGLLILSGLWSLATALQLLGPSPTSQQVAQYLGLVVGIATVFAWLGFASAYAGREYHRQRWFQLGSVAVLGGIVLVKLTNPVHGLYFSTTLVAEPFAYTRFEYGALHWFITGFAYTASVGGFLWLFDSFNQQGSRPWLLYGLVGVTALPLLPYLAAPYVDWLLEINYEPLGVAVFAVGIGAYARSEFEAHSSPGESTLADNLSEAGLLIDEAGIVINSNAEAARLFGSPIPRVPLAEIDERLASLTTGETTQCTYTVAGEQRTYEVTRQKAVENKTAAELLTLKDVTRASRVEELVGLYREINDALVSEADPQQLIERLPAIIAETEGYALVWLYPVDSQPPTSERRPPTADVSADPLGVVAGDAKEYAEAVTATAPAGEPVLSADGTETERQFTVDSSEEWGQQAAAHGITACCIYSLSIADRPDYMLGVYTATPDGFAATEQIVLRELCERVPEAIEAIKTHKEALQFEEAITHAGVAISITDTEGVIQYVNPAFEELTGYSAAEAVGSTHRILKSGEMTDEYYERLWETIIRGQVFADQVIDKTKSGDRYIAQQTVSPVTNEAGQPEAFVAIQFDITDKLLREQRLTVLNRVLRHNIRTAVNVVSGNITLLEDELAEEFETAELPEAIEASLEAIRQRSNHIGGQAETAREIETVLSRSDTDTGEILVRELVSAAKETANSLNASVEVAVDEDVEALGVDSESSQIIDELITNAIIHHEADAGSVDVSLSLSRADDDLNITVEDNGPGLSEQELVVIKQGDEQSLEHSSGLGLWMVNWLAISCGGSISATTSEAGTRITVSLPLREAN